MIEQIPASARNVTADSRQVTSQTVFVAVRGGSHDGHLYIGQAVKQGAVCIVGEDPAEELKGIPYIRAPDSRLALACLAAHFAGHPSKGMTIVGVTGTSGKTTTTYILESILASAGHRVGVIGTINFRFEKKIYPSTHTTPGPVELQKLLAEMKKDGCTAVVMEVSSHALKQHRAAYVAFDSVIFTNLTREHLDFHPNMEDYFRAKASLFTDSIQYSIESGKRPFAGISQDDEWGQRLIEDLRAHPQPELWFASFGLDPNADISGAGLQIDLSGIQGSAAGVRIKSGLTGRFNAQNLLGAIAAAQGLRLDADTIAKGIARLKSVPGRLERVPNRQGVSVWVDYAHKPDALEKVLKTLREVRQGHRLITVVGCGGDRDRSKRPVMGKLAAELSDLLWVTSDNPRTESPDVIIQEILGGITDRTNVRIEPDRRKAIFSAVLEAQGGDLVLIAGKGHEDYQIVADPTAPEGTRKVRFDDREVAAGALDAKDDKRH
ncbi:UDP-N-acetylmuramoyl-L-alanyl-D-glutamate--2,6-diaminopimelate ligase [Bdellovibrionota bacterium FG-1]